jgi:hypothetical protein
MRNDPIQRAISKYNTNEKTVTQGCLKTQHQFIGLWQTQRQSRTNNSPVSETTVVSWAQMAT